MPSTATIATTSKIQAINAIATNAMLDLSKLNSQLVVQIAVLQCYQQLSSTLDITSAVPTTTTPPPGIAIPQQIRAPVPIIPGYFLYSHTHTHI